MNETGFLNNPGCLAPFLKLFQREKEYKLTGNSLPIEIQKNFFSRAEISFYHVLKELVSNEATILAKVRLTDIFYIKDKKNYYQYFNRISRKHLDFLLCQSDTLRPVLAIELDDSSHNRPDRIERDKFVDSVFESADLPLIRIPAQFSYHTGTIYQLLRPYLDGSETEKQPKPDRLTVSMTELVESSTKDESPLCPSCGAIMKIRTSKKGEHAGKKIHLCSRYPDCKKAIPVKSTNA